MLALLTIAAVASASAVPEYRYLIGSVSYREKIALGPNATIRVVIEDVSIADRAAPVIAETTIEAKGKQVPFAYSIKFDSEQVAEGHQYAVRAQIQDGGKLMFTTTTRHSVKLDGTDPRTELVLNKVAAPPAGSIEDTKWLLYELNGRRNLHKGARDLGLTFNADDRKFGAYAGVNQIGGAYELNGFSLKFSDIYSTLMAGPENLMNQEKAFFDMLKAVSKAKQFGDHLVLYQNNRTVAKFKSSNAPRS